MAMCGIDHLPALKEQEGITWNWFSYWLKPRIRRNSAFLIYKTYGYHSTFVIKNVMFLTVPACFFHVRFLLKGEPPKHKRPPSIGSQTNHEMDNLQE